MLPHVPFLGLDKRKRFSIRCSDMMGKRFPSGMEFILRGIDLAIKTATGRQSPAQAANLIRYKLSKPAQILKYSPLTLCLFPTDRCTLKCKMCLTHAASPQAEGNPFRHEPAADMGFDLFREIADRFHCATSLQLIGTGEPLLNKDFFRMVDYASRVRKMEVASTSNGTILHNYLPELAASPLSSLNISLNGHNAAEFERITGHGADIYHTVRENIVRLVQEKKRAGSALKITVSYILDRVNFHHLQEMIDLAHSLGVDGAYLCNYLSTVDTPGLSTHDRCLYEDNAEARQAISRLNVPKNLVIAPFNLLKRKPEGSCQVFFTNIIVDGDGNVGACGKMIQNFKGNGNFNDPDVWNNRYFQEMRLRFLDPQVPFLKPCLSCDNNL